MQDLYSILFIVSFAAIGAAVLYFAFRFYEAAIFLIAFSPWTPFILYQNAHESVMLEEAGVGSYIRISIIIGIGLVGLVKFLQFLPRHKGRIPLQFVLLALFLLLAFVSVAYSIDPDISFIRASTFSAFFCFLLGLYAWMKDEGSLYNALNTLYYLTLVFIILSIVFTVAIPSRVWWWHLSDRFIGIWGHPNSTGLFCLTSYPVLMWKFNESSNIKKILIAGLILFVFAMHILTGSRTSLLASTIGIFTWFIVQKKGIKVLAAAAAIVLFLFIILQLRPQSFVREESNSITDVTGRDQFWNGAVMLVREKPVTGYGYAVEGAIWEDPRFFKEGYDLWSGSNKASLHNGYISILVGVGVPGLLLWLCIFLIPFFRSFKAEKSYYKSFAISVMLMLFVANFAESTINSGSTIGAVYFWISWVIAGKLYQFEKAAETSGDEPETEPEPEEGYPAVVSIEN
jgi:O-antigen ligase